MKKNPFKSLRPGVAIPTCFPLRGADHLAFWLGTGLGSGLLRPAAGTWGSVVGLGYLYLWWLLPGLALKVVVGLAALALSIWCSDRCEKLLQQKDPSSVVIDEIVPVPLSFYPLLHFGEHRWWVWVIAFVIYRVMDIVKLWPSDRLENLGGGLGIVADDVGSAIYSGLLIWGLVWWLGH